MKKALIITVICVVLLGVGVFVVAGKSVRGEAPTDRVKAQGSGEQRIAPDEMVLTLGIVKKNRDVLAAQKEIEKIINGIQKIADDCGAKDDAIQTDCITIRPETAPGGETEYVLTKNLVITLHDVASFDKVYAGAMALGVTNVHNVEFRVSNLDGLKEKAKDMAVEAARHKAEWQAKQLGKRIVRVEVVNEGGAQVLNWYDKRNEWAYQDYKVVQTSNIALDTVMGSKGAAMVGGVEPNVRYAFGQIVITSSVEVTFIIGD